MRDWEIFNRPGKGRTLPYTFPAIFTKTGSGWGTFSQQLIDTNLVAKIGVTWGELELQRIRLDVPSDCPCKSACVGLGGKDLQVTFEREGDAVTVTLAEPVRIAAGQELEIAVS